MVHALIKTLLGQALQGKDKKESLKWGQGESLDTKARAHGQVLI